MDRLSILFQKLFPTHAWLDPMSRNLFSIAFVLLCIASESFAQHADWPQWRGPHRDGHAAPQELLKSWPKNGPPLKWQYENAGRGYSTLTIAGDRAYTLGSDETGCFAICLDVNNGSKIWQTNVGKASQSGDYNHGWGGGPRSSITIDGGQLFGTSDLGVVFALDQNSGELQWSVDLVKQYGSKVPVWGYSESPLVDGDRVVVTPGGKHFMVALKRGSGEEVWRTPMILEKEDYIVPQYVSPIKAGVDGVTFYVTASKPGLFAFDTTTGEQVFSDDTTGNKVAVIPTPIIVENQLYHTSDYGAGNSFFKMSAGEDGKIVLDEVYHLEGKTMRNHHGGVVLVDGVIYGFSKIDGGVWMAQDLETGDVLWKEKAGRNKSGSIAFADGRLYCYNDKDGTCLLVKPSPAGWEAVGGVKLPSMTGLERDKGAIWAHPVIANQTLFIRDQDLIFAFDITAK